MNTASLQFLQTFRQKLLGIFPRRADALFELIDALLLSLDPRSAVALSLSPAFRRRFSMVYDALRHGQVDPALARQLLASAEPVDALEVGGYAVYALDSTVHPRQEAETLADRGKVYSASQAGAVPGHQYSWLGRVIAQGQSWFAPRDVERIATSTTPAGVAAEQVKRLALSQATELKAVIWSCPEQLRLCDTRSSTYLLQLKISGCNPMFCHWYPTSLNQARLGQCSLIRKDSNPIVRNGCDCQHQGGQELGLDGMVNKCELLINVVIVNKPKMLKGLGQKARGQVQGLSASLTQMVAHRRIDSR